MNISSINPFTGKIISSYNTHTIDQVTAIVKDSAKAQDCWRQQSVSDRSACLLKLAALLIQNKERGAKLITQEMGKPISQSRAEIEKCAFACNYYAENAEKFLAPHEITTEQRNYYIYNNPLGLVLAVMPWNFPFWQVIRAAAPILAAGNGFILKHSSNVPGCAFYLEELFLNADFPKNLFRTLLIPSNLVDPIIAMNEISAVTVTGSNAAGSAIAASAGRHIKKSLLELGGNDPYIILEDADIQKAAETCVRSRMINGGQSCIAAKRFIVVETIADAFTEAVQTCLQSYRCGDPMLDSTLLGPLARFDLRDELHQQVQFFIQNGAQLHCGGYIPKETPAFYPPTLLTHIDGSNPLLDVELFGPIATIIRARDEAQALEFANNSRFGLGSAIFSSDPIRAKSLAVNAIHSGACFINDFVQSDPRVPFGGIHESGYGRELSINGLLEFVNTKTIAVPKS